MEVIDGCNICGDEHLTEFCPELGLSHSQIQLDQLSTRARLTLPSFLEVVDNGSGLVGVVAKEIIPNKTQFGPFEAKRTTHIFDDNGFFTLKLIAKDGTTVCLDTTDENVCNWLCLVRCAVSVESRNCMAYQLGTNIYYNTTMDIAPGEELLVWYAPSFARKLGKPTEPTEETRVLLGHRIEPLTCDVTDVVMVQDIAPYMQRDESNVDSVDDNQVERLEATELTPGEIRKAHYCPRCGNTFDTQNEMVLHLRQHVIGVLEGPKRGRGRPRKTPVDSKRFLQVKGKRGPGRPKLAVTPDKQIDKVAESASSEFDQLTDKKSQTNYAIKRKYKSGDSVHDDETSYDDGDDDCEEELPMELDSFDACDDKEYAPQKEVAVMGSRLQPKRSTRGKHSKYEEDYVYGKEIKTIKKEYSKIDEVSSYFNNPGESNMVKQDISVIQNNHNVVNDSENKQIPCKKGRGRPRKIKQEDIRLNEKTKNEIMSVDHVKESLAALKDDTGKNMNDKVNGANHIKLENQVSNGVINEMMESDNLIGIVDIVVNNPNEARVMAKDDDKKITAKKTLTDKDVENNCETDGQNFKDDILVDETTVKHKEIHVNGDADSKGDNEDKDNNFDGKNLLDHQESISREENGTVLMKDKELLVIMFEETEDNKYCCILCDEKFAKEIEAIDHFINHDKGGGSCKACKQEFDSIEKMWKHRKNCIQIKEEGVITKKNNYTCDICQQAFASAHYLYRHMVMHTDTYTCFRCKKTFSRKDSLHKHVLKCCPDLAKDYKIFYCEVCFRVFSLKSGLERHKKKCKLVLCDKCKKVLSSLDDLDQHICQALDMDDAAKYSCGLCHKAFQSMYYLQQHKLLHSSKFSCPKCTRAFLSQEELEHHKLICETLEEIKCVGNGKCGLCNNFFTSGKVFREHYLSHTHPYQCDKCLKRFIKIGTLSSHDCQALVFFCTSCSKTFRSESTLDKHKKERGCKKYECTGCGMQFHMKTKAKEHVCEAGDDVDKQIVNTSDSQEVCPTCGKSFSSKSNLSKHTLLHGEKKFQCVHCQKKFHIDTYLKEHIMSVHFNICKYQCTDCGQLMKSKTGLIAHTRIFHTKNAEVFPCSKCGKVFKQKGNLRMHMYSHSTERKFNCIECGRSFKYPDQLSRHKLEHNLMHSKLTCIHCDKQFLHPYELRKHSHVYHSGYVYVCQICSTRCGHRATLVRHYKRKHPECYDLVSKEGYLETCIKHVSQILDSQNNSAVTSFSSSAILILDKNTNNDQVNFSTSGMTYVPGEQNVNNSEMVSQDAAEVLQSLSSGGSVTVTQKQFDKFESIIFMDESGNVHNQQVTLVNGHPVIISGNSAQPQGSGLIHGATNYDMQNMAFESLENTIDMIQNADGTVSINGIQGIPQTLETLGGSDGQIVILQIVEPEGQDQQGEVNQQIQEIEAQDEHYTTSVEIITSEPFNEQDHSDIGEIGAITADTEADITNEEDLVHSVTADVNPVVDNENDIELD